MCGQDEKCCGDEERQDASRLSIRSPELDERSEEFLREHERSRGCEQKNKQHGEDKY